MRLQLRGDHRDPPQRCRGLPGLDSLGLDLVGLDPLGLDLVGGGGGKGALEEVVLEAQLDAVHELRGLR